MMTDKCFDLLVTLQRWLTALGALYLGLAAIWGFPWGDEINQSIVVICTFLAAVIEIQKSIWNKTHTITVSGLKEEEHEE